VRRWFGLMLVVAAVGGVSPAASSGFSGEDDPPFQPLPPAQPIPPGGVAAVQKTILRTVRGAGSVQALGRLGSASFSVDLSKGPGRKVTYVDVRRSVDFRSLRLRSVRFGTGRATLNGIGLVNGRRVAFTAVAIDRGTRGDVFRISWGGGRSHGGVLLSGGLAVH
jgi:hypothetical protein